MNKKLLLLALLAIIFVATSCANFGTYEVGPTETTSHTFERGDAESLEAKIRMGIGKLEVDGGANDMAEAEFTYNVEDWRPELEYDVRNGNGRLLISQPSNTEINGIPDDDIKYNWDIRLNNDVPTELNIDLGAGESDLDLRDLHLTDLKIDMGAGKSNIDLSGDWPESFDVEINGGVGSTEITLPNNVGVRVKPTTGIGNVEVYGLIRNGDVYTNDLYGEVDVELDISVNSGIGEITLRTE
jgi:hypothetical protein